MQLDIQEQLVTCAHATVHIQEQPVHMQLDAQEQTVHMLHLHMCIWTSRSNPVVVTPQSRFMDHLWIPDAITHIMQIK